MKLARKSHLYFSQKTKNSAKNAFISLIGRSGHWKNVMLHVLTTSVIVYRNTRSGNWKILIIDLIVNIILDYLKKTVHNVFTITAKEVFCKSMEVPW